MTWNIMMLTMRTHECLCRVPNYTSAKSQRDWNVDEGPPNDWNDPDG